MSHLNPTTGPHFSDLGISTKLLSILDRWQFTVPTPIQQQAIPVAVTGKDVIGIAQTGTGKTLAFAVPLLQRIMEAGGQALILVPTRELAVQVEESVRKLGESLGMRGALLIGGASMQLQMQALRRQPHIIIGTPGRILDHLESGRLQLDQVRVLVLDEADRMLDMGFAPQIKRILERVPRDRQTMLFSATMPAEIVKIAATHMRMPVRVEVAPAGSVAQRVNQELFIVRKDQKNRLLDSLLTEYKGAVLVFARTKYGAKRVCRSVRGMGHSTAEIHSNLSLSQRRRSLEGFKSGHYRVLVATDIAARGIDVINIALVINYDLPDNLDDYVHRVGRTGRAGLSGHAISFVTPDQRGKVQMLERVVRQRLSISSLPQLPAERADAGVASEADDRSHWQRGSRFRQSRSSSRSPRQSRGPARQSRRSGSRRQVRVHR